MKWPSLTLIFSGIFLAYVLHSMWTLAQIFIVPKCEKGLCFKSYLADGPKLDMLFYISPSSRPDSSISATVKPSSRIKKFNYEVPFEQEVNFDVKFVTEKNRTAHMHVIVAPSKAIPQDLSLIQLLRIKECTVLSVRLSQLTEKKLTASNLLSGDTGNQNQDNLYEVIPHIKKSVTILMLQSDIVLPYEGLPFELARYMRLTKQGTTYLPILTHDFLQTRTSDLEPIEKDVTKTVLIKYQPCSPGWLRFVIQVEQAMLQLKTLGFNDRDIDEVKRVFSETNVYLLLGTMLVGSIHLLLDFLSFKSDVQFWRKTNSMAGLSRRTVIWRAFSQGVIFLYLMDEKTSMLVLIPSAIGTIIEFWKVVKVLKRGSNETLVEKQTRDFDNECMYYLAFILYPLCILGALYSLLYRPHRSWYSWTIDSLANGVYAFGFLFMLPQLFVNYRLKSVAALPWKAFTYRAFTTFIDDIFAFIITMPTAHRLACFRDDIVFLVYLYQRYLYPVDKTRTEDEVAITENIPENKKTQ